MCAQGSRLILIAFRVSEQLFSLKPSRENTMNILNNKVYSKIKHNCNLLHNYIECKYNKVGILIN